MKKGTYYVAEEPKMAQTQSGIPWEMFALRLPQEIRDQLNVEAQKRNTGRTVLARELIQRGLNELKQDSAT